MTVRVFLVTCGVCLLAVALVSWQSYRMFYQSQYQQKREQLLDEAAAIAVDVDALLKSFRKAVDQSLVTPENFDEFTKVWEKSHPGMTYGFYLIDQSKSNIVASKWFEIRDEKLMLGKTSEVASLELEGRAKSFILARVPTGEFYFEDMQEALGLPILSLVYSPDVKGKKSEQYRYVAFVWKNKLFGKLVGEDSKQYLLVGQNQSLVGMSGIPSFNKNALKKSYFKKFFKAKKPLGFVEKSVEGSRLSVKYWTYSYRKLATQQNIFVLVREDYRKAFLGVKRVVGSALLWASLFVLLLLAICYFTIFNYSAALVKSVNAMRRIAKGDLSPVQFEDYGFEINGLNYAINRLSENFSRALRQQKSQAQQTKTIEMSDAIKQGIMPLHKPNHDFLGITTFTRPTSDFTGNWFGSINLRPGVSCVFMGENSGRGASTAIHAASLCAACELLLKSSARAGDGYPDIEQVMNDLNQYVYEAGSGQTVAKLLITITDFNTGKIDYINASMQQPFIIQRKDVQQSARATSEIQSLGLSSEATPIVLDASSLPLGVKPDFKYQKSNIAIKPGDKIFIFSSGLVKCRSILGRPWGRKSLIENALTLAKSTADATREELIERVAHHSRGAGITDDIGLLILEVSKEWVLGAPLDKDESAVS